MSPKLAKRRNAQAEKFALDSGYTMTYDRARLFEGYVRGFDACFAEMLPMLEQLVTALNKIRQYEDRNIEIIIDGALAAYQAWRGEGEQ